MLKPEDMMRFHNVPVDQIMEIVVDVLGRDAADRIVAEWYDIEAGKIRRPSVVWPRFR